jgi:hypothetical protein
VRVGRHDREAGQPQTLAVVHVVADVDHLLQRHLAIGGQPAKRGGLVVEALHAGDA